MRWKGWLFGGGDITIQGNIEIYRNNFQNLKLSHFTLLFGIGEWEQSKKEEKNLFGYKYNSIKKLK